MANRSPGDSVAADSSTDRPGSIDHNWAAFFLMRRLCFWFPSLTYKSDELMKASVEFLPQSIGSWFSSAIITVPPPQLMDNNGLKVRTFHTTIDISSPPQSLPPSLPPLLPHSIFVCSVPAMIWLRADNRLISSPVSLIGVSIGGSDSADAAD